jgi:cysteine desulfurase / selenocysteine lyase
MSTSEQNTELPQGWPDIETLARLANEFFTARPGEDATRRASAEPININSIPHDLNGEGPLAKSVPSPVSLPGEAELRALLDVFSAPPATPSSVPAGTPSFYFLEHANAGPVVSSVPQPALQGLSSPLDIGQIRKDFPILEERVNGRQLVWLDNAATTQKPRAVIDRLKHFYEHENSNVHRAAHELAARATDAYESARDKVRGFLNASSSKEIVFVRGATEAINLVAQSWGRQNIGKDDEILITWLEHHANIVPWQQLANEKGARLKVVPVDDNGQVLLDAYSKLLGPKTKLVSFAQVSNALGTITPAKQIIESAHAAGAKVLLDGAQAVSHMPVNVQDLNPDWYVFSGHKVFAPTGIGVLYGKEGCSTKCRPGKAGAT